SGDFCLMSRRAADIINQMPEKNRFMRGMRSWIGFKQAPLLYERQERKAGISKYNLRKLLRLAADGIFNFSDLPVRLITMAGLGVMTIAGAYLLYALVQKWVYGISPQGFTGLLAVIVLLSGVQLLSLGIIGEYVLRIFFQPKDRPFYVVEQVVRRQTHT
ncbi:MAG TPA: glycosyltransferase, partial [Phnomibacter sp.]|nr:glycosyltransferase [Phnomibacter sp.]